MSDDSCCERRPVSVVLWEIDYSDYTKVKRTDMIAYSSVGADVQYIQLRPTDAEVNRGTPVDRF